MSNSDNSIEWQFLLHICQLAITNKKADKATHFSVEQIDWEHVLSLAKRHRIRPLLFKGLQNWGYLDRVPGSFIDTLKAIVFQLAIQNLNHSRELSRILDLFNQHQISVIPYKGIVLAQAAFLNLNAREASDIDLLIQLEDLPTIRTILEANGYQALIDVVIPNHLLARILSQIYEFNFDLIKDGKRVFHVEPHWLVGPKWYQLDLEWKDFVPFLQKQQLVRKTHSLLNPEGNLLITCLHHGGQDNWRTLKQVADIAALINRYGDVLNWNLVLHTAKKWDVEQVVLLGIRIAEQLFSLELPAAVKNRPMSKKMKQHLTACIATLQLEVLPAKASGSASGILKQLVFHLSLRDHWRTKMKIIYYHLLRIFLPNEGDLKRSGKTVTNYWAMLINKPFRLWTDFFKN